MITLNSFTNAQTLSFNTATKALVGNGAANEHYFAFTPSTTGVYTFESSNIISGPNNTCDPYGWLYNSSSTTNPNLLTYNDDGGTGSNFRITYHLQAGQKYYLKAGTYNNASEGRYTVKVTTSTGLSPLSPTSITTSASKAVSISSSCERKYFTFTASSAGTYIFQSSGGSVGGVDPTAWLVNSSTTQLATDDDSGGTRNFKITYNLTSGQTVYLVAGCYGTGSGSYTVTVTKI